MPFGLDRPYWIEDPDFDIDYHVRHHAVPPPGDPHQLAEVVGRIHARPLDRRHPLWELYVIEGVDNGRLVAQVTKVHHAAVDGAAGAHDARRHPRHRPRRPPDTAPRRRGRPTRSPSERAPPANAGRIPAAHRTEFVRHTYHTLRRVAEQVVEREHACARPSSSPGRSRGRSGSLIRNRLRGGEHTSTVHRPFRHASAPRTPFNASITAHRRFAYTTLPLEDAKSIRRAHDCTFNDVVMALCSGTLRRYLIEHDALPERVASWRWCR